jgi:hypothetical protein
MRQAVTAPAGAVTFSVWLRSYDGTSSYVMQLTNAAGTGSAITVTGTWQQFTVTGTAGGASVNYQIRLRGAQSPTNSNTADILMSEPQVETGSIATTYQRIAAATDYNSTNFKKYLRFDGTDDSLSTGNIDFSAVDKMTVHAGLRKGSDAAQGIFTELTSSIASNNGGFLLSAPNSAAANYNFSSKGTTLVNNTVTTYTAPITSVITGQADISAPSNIIRVNGSQVGSVSTSQGTGTYANAALYIGRRGGSTLPFNGNLYHLIVRGAQSTAAQITSAETWVNEKTGAY